MSAPPGCPRCGYVNAPGYAFCTNCGAPLGPAAPAGAPRYPSPPAYSYAAAAAGPDWIRQVDRTKTGVFLLFVGSLLSWIPFGVSVLGVLLLLIGAILVIVGRKPFGPTHARFVMVSIVLFAIGIVIVVFVALVALLPAVSSIVSSGGAVTPQTQAAAQNAGLTGSIAFAIVVGVAEVLFTYALQKETGRILLWTGYLANVVVAVTLFLVMNPVYNAVVTSADLGAALSVQVGYTLISVVPSLIYAAADYLAWSRIRRGEIPALPSVPAAPWTPPYPSSPRPPQTPPPSGPAPPMNPP